MSIKVMTRVFEMDLPPSEKVTALALADHAHDDGTEARPSVARLAVKTSLSARQVQRVLKSLVAKGVLEVQRQATNNHPVVYRFDLTWGDNLSEGDTGGDLGVTPEAFRGDTDVTLTFKEPSDKSFSTSTIEDHRLIEIRSEYQRLCAMLADAIASNGSKRPTVTERWVNEMRLLIERDGRTTKQVENMIRWCQQDPFWRSNILSVVKLRAKYDQMRLKAIADTTSTVSATTNEDELAERRARMMKQKAQRVLEESERARQDAVPMPDELRRLRKRKIN